MRGLAERCYNIIKWVQSNNGDLDCKSSSVTVINWMSGKLLVSRLQFPYLSDGRFTVKNFKDSFLPPKHNDTVNVAGDDSISSTGLRFYVHICNIIDNINNCILNSFYLSSVSG